MSRDTHDCKYDIRAVNHEYKRSMCFGSFGDIEGTTTIVLKVCTVCGAITTDTVNGKWTIEQINGGR